MQKSESANILEKIGLCSTYATCGLTGVIWLIVANLVFKRDLRPFILYHIYQSIIFWMFIVALSYVFSFFINLLISIPIVGSWIGNFMLIFNTPKYFGLSIINLLVSLIVIYLMLGVILGRYSQIPFISEIVKRNIDRR